MDLTHLDPFSAAGTKRKQIQDAKDMFQVVADRAARTGTAVPDYEFLELIGKGTFGRVYKCKKNVTEEVVAVKIIDVDDLDYKLDLSEKDEAIEDFRKEVKTLKHLKDSRAKNINYIQEAFDLHSQLWIVSDYCPGGSVHTLMKATPVSGLEEKFIIPIARELAVALRYVHDAGVIHRDVKCGNVLISEDGQVQLCDFGVAAIIESDATKRSTIIGTPFWMPPEMHSMDMMQSLQGYGTEVDCWAFGCTVYEMATGMPPNHKINPYMLKTVLKEAPRLQGGAYSDGLRDFVAYCLEESPQHRPSMHEILQHPYIANTSMTYPTATVRQMIDRYVQWERKGGQRASLFNPLGAAAPQPTEQRDDYDDWNFSTTDNFEIGFAKRYSQLGIVATDFATMEDNPIETPTIPGTYPVTPLEQAQEEARARRGERSMGRLFNPDAEPYDYNIMMEEDQQLSDLPLRNMASDRAANRETLIDLDMGASGLDVQPTFNFDFSDVPTLKAARPSRLSFVAPDEEEEEDYSTGQDQNTKRATRDWRFPTSDQDTRRATKDWRFPSSDQDSRRITKDWKFPLTMIASDNPSRRTQDWTFATAQPLAGESDPEPESIFTFPPMKDETDIAPGFRPQLTRTATEPIGQFNGFLHPPVQPMTSRDLKTLSVRDSKPVIDLDLGMEYEPNFGVDTTVQPQLTAESPASAASSTDTSRNPFFLDEIEQTKEEDVKRSSHRQSRSEPQLLAPVDRRSRLLHSRGPSSESILRHSRDRGFSYSSTASSDLHDLTWSKDYNRRMEAHMREQLLNGLHTTAMAPRNSWARFGGTDSLDDTDTETPMGGTGVSIPDIDDPDYPVVGGLKSSSRIDAFNIDTDDSAYGEMTMSRNRPRADTVGTASTSTGYDSSREDPLYMPYMRGNRVLNEFPRLSAPDSDVLADGADPELVCQEMDRLFADLESGLGLAADLFQRRDREISRGRDERDDFERHARGFGSEGDGEDAAM